MHSKIGGCKSGKGIACYRVKRLNKSVCTTHLTRVLSWKLKLIRSLVFITNQRVNGFRAISGWGATLDFHTDTFDVFENVEFFHAYPDRMAVRVLQAGLRDSFGECLNQVCMSISRNGTNTCDNILVAHHVFEAI